MKKSSKKSVEARARGAVELLLELNEGDLEGERALIVGRGVLGKAIEKKLRALKLKTWFYDASAPHDQAGSTGLPVRVRGMPSANLIYSSFSSYVFLAGDKRNKGALGKSFRPSLVDLKIVINASNPDLVTEEELKKILLSKKKAERVIVGCFKDNAWGFDWLDKPIKQKRLVIK
jgi:phosphoglycerate dehydrogenase-like enzyme